MAPVGKYPKIREVAQAAFYDGKDEDTELAASEAICSLTSVFTDARWSSKSIAEAREFLLTTCLMHSLILANYWSHGIYKLAEVYARLGGWLSEINDDGVHYVYFDSTKGQCEAEKASSYVRTIQTLVATLNHQLLITRKNIEQLAEYIAVCATCGSNERDLMFTEANESMHGRFIMCDGMVQEIIRTVGDFCLENNITGKVDGDMCDFVNLCRKVLKTQLRETAKACGCNTTYKYLKDKILY